MKTTNFILFLTTVLILGCRQNEISDQDFIENGADLGYVFEGKDTQLGKTFPFLYYLSRDQEISAFLIQDNRNDSLYNVHVARITANLERCGDDINCLLGEISFTGGERQVISNLFDKWSDAPIFQRLYDEHLIRSGFFQLYLDYDLSGFMMKVWQDAALSLGNTIDVYGKGEAPFYPDIDSISYQIDDDFFAEEVRKILKSSIGENGLFFQPILEIALKLLDLNRRDEASRYEPLRDGQNRAAFEYIPEINWEDYPYSAIVVLGDGPEKEGVPIESLGLFRVRLGVERYKNGMAPLIVLTGGHVKPFLTPYSEAIEMKRVIMEQYDLPENVLLVDPHARHTTTNLRNTSRLLMRYGVPLDKKVLVTTSESHSTYVTSPKFHSRCLNELGYLPVILEDRVSEYDVEFLPKIESLHVNSMDPLDP